MKKSLKHLLVLPLTVATLLFAGTAAKADPFPLTITLDSPFQIGGDGDTLSFAGTITNTGSSTVNLGGDSFTLGGTFTIDDSGYINNAPFTLDPGGTSGDIDLFTITILPGTETGVYAGAFDILDGSTVVGEAAFDVSVVTPEPGTILLMGTGFLALAGLILRRMPKGSASTPA
jgi:PEP-CTERM motif